MDKIAQRRGRLSKLKELVYAPGEKVMGKFSPEFIQLMDNLREIDDAAREEAETLKELLKLAQSNFNRREYINTIVYLGKFHEKLESIKQHFGRLIKDVNKIHYDFLFGELEPEHKEYLFKVLPEKLRARPKAAEYVSEIEKVADLADWWHGISTSRGRALKAWEKRFPRFARELKLQTERLLKKSEDILRFTLSTFKTLAALRATRKLEDYVRNTESFISKFNGYNSFFRKYYDVYAKKLMASQAEDKAITPPEETSSTEKIETPIAVEGPPTIKSEEPTIEKEEEKVPLGRRWMKETPEEFSARMKKHWLGETEEQKAMTKGPSSLFQQMPSLSPEEAFPLTHEKKPSLFQHMPTIPADEKPHYSKPIPLKKRKPTSIFQHMPELIEPPTEKTIPLPLMQRKEPSTIPSSFVKKTPVLVGEDTIDLENPKIPPPPAVPKEMRETIRPGKRSSTEFIQELTKLAFEDPLVIAKEIITFAETQDDDTKERLLKIARQLLG